MAITFDTIFKIGAVFTGAAAMNQAQTAVTKLQEKGLLASLSLKKMVVAVGGLAAGYLTVDKLTGFINSSIDAARKAKTAYQGIGDALSKVPQMQKAGTAAIENQKQKLKELAVQMEKTGIIASESMAAAFSKLIESGMDPDRIYRMSGAFQDLVVKIKGVKPSLEDVAGVGEQLGNAIRDGGKVGADALIQLGILTEDQRDKFESLRKGADRYNLVLSEMQKQTGATAEAMKTWEGVQARFQNAWKDIKVAIGTPFMEAQDKVTEALTKIQTTLIENASKISTSITPVISKYADKVSDFFVKLIESSNKWGPKLDEVGKTIEKVFGWFTAHPEATTGITAAVGALGGIGVAAGVIAPVADLAKKLTDVAGVFKLLVEWGPKVGSAIATAFAAAGPAGWITLAIAAVIAGLVLVITHWDWVKEHATMAWDAIVKTWGNFTTWWEQNVTKPFIEQMDKWRDSINKALSDLFDVIIAPFKKAFDWIAEHNPIKALTPDVSKEAQATRAATLSPVQLSDTQRLQAAREADEKLGMGHHEHFHALEKVIEAEHLAQKQQVQNTEAVTASTNALYGKSPGFIPGVQEATATLAKFENSLSQAQMSVGAVGAVGGGGISGAGGGMSLGAGGVSGGIGGFGGSAGGIQVTHYGYEKKGDKDWDSNSARGIGAYNNKLTAGFDVALNRKSAAMLGINYDRDLGKVFNYQGRQWRYGDRTAEWLPNPRFDVYDPGGNLVKGQYGGLVSHPSLALLGEKIPEMTIPLEGTSHSRSLLGAAASMMGMGRGGGRGGEVSLSMNAPITIHGVQSGEEGAIAREVQRALQDPIRNLLEQLKRAKQQEQRLAYA